jgi:chitinase
MKRVIAYLLAAMALVFAAASCGNDDGVVVPPPGPGNKTAVDEGNGNGDGNGEGNGDGTGTTDSGTETSATANLCKEEYLGQKPMIIAYLTEYTSASSLDASCLTHINYAHGRFKNPKTGDGGIVIAEPTLLKKVVALKEKKPSLKVLLMIGGWGEHADGFSMMARDAAKRTEFCQSCKAHIDTYGLDGIDIDWEYPGGGPSTNGKSNDDPKNFVLVLKELRETIGDTKIISYASSSSAKYMDWKGAMDYLDYVNVMTYDMGKPPKHNSPLMKSAIFNQDGCKESVDLHVKAGVPKSRQNLGVPFYGHGISPYDSDVKYVSMASILNATTGNYVGKNIRRWDDTAKVPYLTDAAGTIYLSYDDPESVGYKGKFVKDNGLCGAMFWEFRHDDANGSMRKALCTAIYGKESTTD